MADLLSLRGVARKTANVMLGDYFKKPEGIVVDTHVKRLAYRLGLTGQTDPVKVEKDLTGVIPYRYWGTRASVHWADKITAQSNCQAFAWCNGIICLGYSFFKARISGRVSGLGLAGITAPQAVPRISRRQKG